jgi:ATP-dependent Clp protease ATP-binding subunit ClpA
MFERFTNQSRRVVVLAQDEARAFNHNYIGTEHILLGLVREGKGTAARALKSLDVTLDAARQKLEEIVGRGQKGQPSGHIPFTRRAKKVLELSLREAQQLGDDSIATGHILLGMMRQGDSVGVQMLVSLGTDLNLVRERVTRELADGPEQGQDVPDRLVQARLQVRPRRRDEIKGLLDTIDERLSAIEQQLGITRAVPDELRSLDERIAEVRRDKEAAIEVQDFDRAAALRDTERQLLAERARVEREAEAGGSEGADEGKGSAEPQDPPAAAG